MTKRQKEIYEALKKGSFIEEFVSGWYFRQRLLRVETEDRLRLTNELVRITRSPEVRSSSISKIVHLDCVKSFLKPGDTVGELND